MGIGIGLAIGLLGLMASPFLTSLISAIAHGGLCTLIFIVDRGSPNYIMNLCGIAVAMSYLVILLTLLYFRIFRRTVPAKFLSVMFFVIALTLGAILVVPSQSFEEMIIGLLILVMPPFLQAVQLRLSWEKEESRVLSSQSDEMVEDNPVS